MILKAMPKRDFRISVKQYAPRSLMTKCPGTPPIWVTNLVSGGSNMSLAGVMVQAGRHFADSLNMEVFSGNATRRQEATKLAWMLVAMIRPELNEEFLEINDPGDGDIKRLASEILGVGAALELLRIQGAIDARTIRKISTRFDYEANAVGGAGRVLIEAKGTSNCSTIHEHRKSFASKIASLSKQGASRGYSRAIGIIFSTWTKGSPRGIDVEIMDPEGKKESLFEESVREIIKFYARRFDETAGLPEAAERLYRLASYDLLFQANSPISEYVGADTVSEHIFNRSSFVFALRSKPRTFWGTF